MRGARAIGLITAMALSSGVHLAGAGYFTPDAVELDGGGDTAPARLGSSFADMVAGMPDTARPDVIDPVEVEETAQEPLDPTEAETPPDTDPTEPMEANPSEVALTGAAQARNIAEAEALDAMSNVPVAENAPPTLAEAAIVALPSIETSVIAAVPEHHARPAAAQPPVTAAPTATPSTAAASSAEIMVAEDEAVLTPLSSPRPRTRPEGLAPPPPEPQAQPQPPTATGSAAESATQGSTTGSEVGTAAATTPDAQPSPQPGNAAAVANYPGQVLRRISRAGRPRVRHTGADVVISFRIGSGGGLDALSVTRSSGNPDLDQAGMSIVQRAAPFPSPPAGAQTSFSINFGGR